MKIRTTIIILTIALALSALLAACSAGARDGLQGNAVISDFSTPRYLLGVRKVIPFSAVIENAGHDEADYLAELVLPAGAELVRGPVSEKGALRPGEAALLDWKISFAAEGEYRLKLRAYSGAGSDEKALVVRISDDYWRQRRFLLTAYSPPYGNRGPPYRDADFEYYKNANFDTIMWVRDDDALVQKVRQFGFRYFLSIADLIDEEKLRGEINAPPEEITEEDLRAVDEAVEKYKDDPNLIGYYLCDEPYPSAFFNIAKVVARIRAKDPQRPTYVNLFPYFLAEEGSPEYIEAFLQTTKVQLLSFDRYVFFNDGYDERNDFLQNLATFRDYALKYGVPFVSIIQAIGTNGTSADYLNWRTPSEAEHRWQVYTSLAFGVHGIVWFHWDYDWGVTGNPDRDVVYPSIKRLNKEINALGPVMVRLTSTQVYGTGPDPIGIPVTPFQKRLQSDADLVVGFFRDGENEPNYFMLTNRSFTDSLDSEAALSFQLDDLEWFNPDSAAWESVPYNNEDVGAKFTFHLRPGGGKLYRFSAR